MNGACEAAHNEAARIKRRKNGKYAFMDLPCNERDGGWKGEQTHTHTHTLVVEWLDHSEDIQKCK